MSNLPSVIAVSTMQAAITAGVGLFVGVAAGVVAVLLAHTTPDRIQTIHTIYWSLVFLGPVGAWFAHDSGPHGVYGENGVRAYANLPSALLTSGVGALVGMLVGALLLFPFVPGFLPVLVAGEDAATFGLAVRSILITTPLWMMLVTTVGAALFLGTAAYRRTQEDQYD